jgi:hypothetical protein
VHLLRPLICAIVGALVLTVAPSYAGGPDPLVKAERRLNALHCDAGRGDGRIDQHARSAIVRFQSRVGLRQSARLDVPTRKRLYAANAPLCDVRPVPVGSGEGRRIVISQRQNWIWLVGPGGHVVAQGGMVDNPSVLHPGSHATGSYCGRGARIKLNQAASGNVWLDNFVRFAPCGIGFHRIPRYKSSGVQMHADWVLGTNQATSHGCIRLSRKLSLRVWDFTVRRTPVRVV